MSTEDTETAAAPPLLASQGIGTILTAILAALAVGAVLIAGYGANPVAAYAALLKGSFGSWNSLAETLLRTIPLCFAGLAVALAFRGGAFNLGTEGQIYLGATAAAAVGLQMKGADTAVILTAMLLAAAIAGALWSGLAGVMKLRFGANELITTIMMNYIAIFFVSWLLHGPLQEAMGYMAQTDRLPREARFPTLIPHTRLHWGFVLVLIAVIGTHLALWHTTWGFRLRVLGLNARAALNAGYRVTALSLSAFLISGALGGIGGMIEMVGIQHRMIENFSPGYGYTGIIVALLGRTSPLGVFLAAILFAALQVGATTMESAAGVPGMVTTIIQGIIVLFLIGRGAGDWTIQLWRDARSRKGKA